jgi:DNA-binding CsgD family transcriptional regulator
VTLATQGRDAPLPYFRVPALAVLGIAQARRGEPGAWAHLDEALQEAAQAARLRLMVVHAARAETAFLAGDTQRAGAEAHLGLEIGRRHGSPWVLGELAYWQWRAGSLEPPPDGIAEPFALQLSGDWRAAAERWRELGCPYESARALLDAEDEGALRAAYVALDRLGARAVARMATARLRRAGARAIPRGRRSGSRTNVFGLTPREQEVLRLVADGLTDAEIAARLFLARKTVSHHVSAILAKCGVDSRRAAARLLLP